MSLRRELLFLVGVFLTLNLLLSFGSIGLLSRMGPAIERIMSDNVYSITAAEAILNELARSGDHPLPGDARTRVQAALERVQKNVTELDERKHVRILAARMDAAVSGDSAARVAALSALAALIDVNRKAMTEADQRARRLGNAGAWTAVFVGFMSLLLGALALVRLRKRLLKPLIELHQVLEGVEHGVCRRRCHAREAPIEIQHVAESVNRLLDERRPASTTEGEDAQLTTGALPIVLDHLAQPAALTRATGELLAANSAMLALLAGDEGENIRRAMKSRASATDMQRVPIDDLGALILITSNGAPLT